MSEDVQVPPEVLSAFGLESRREVLSGGQGRSVRCGDVVLKQIDDAVEASWAAELLSNLSVGEFRLSRPVRAQDGHWVVDGWIANEYLAGQPGPAGRWEELLVAGRAFHRALGTVQHPAFLADRSHRWAHADRVAWGEDVADPLPGVAPLLARLERLIRPVTGLSQLIHGDLAGNVLFCEGLAPAIIDFSPYWRPAEYADAIVAVDGLLWFNADRGLISAVATSSDSSQYLARAAVFRLVALNERARAGEPLGPEELATFQQVVTEIGALL